MYISTLRRGEMMWTRSCPMCGDMIEYKNRRSIWLGNKTNAKCRKCYIPEISKTINRLYETGELVSRGRPKTDSSKHICFRSCPRCGNEIGYASRWSRKRANKNESLCDSCSNYVYKKTWNDVITKDHVKKMRASKAGFTSWDEYVDGYPDKQFYKREVWRLTYKQPVSDLPHWEKRGRCGVDGAFQLDHITSINEGYQSDIPPEEIAHISNLRMIPWEENRRKG